MNKFNTIGVDLAKNVIQVSLRFSDIDSTRMVLRIEQGKGSKDRYALLSPVLLDSLRAWWRCAHAERWILDGGWIFPGRDPIDPMSTRTLSQACIAAAKDAGLDKLVSMHTLIIVLPLICLSKMSIYESFKFF